MTNYKFAPDLPATEELLSNYPLSKSASGAIAAQRLRVSEILQRDRPGLVAIIGDCSLTNCGLVVQQAGTVGKIGFRRQRSVIEGLYRVCYWKPRTNPETAWNGLETTEPEAAFALINEIANKYANGAAEIGRFEHVLRYGSRLAFGWFGARNDSIEEIAKIALYDPSLPLGIKTDLDGSISSATSKIMAISQLTGERKRAAPLIPIFRGGNGLMNPRLWENEYKRSFDTTGGFIVDAAHGSGAAHDNGNKTSIGQQRCLEHILTLATSGYMPLGLMSEASDIPSRTDEVIPIDFAIESTKYLAGLLLARAA